MDASNLATLFAPNILHKSIKELSSNDLSEEMTMERRLAIDVVTGLIVNYEYLFKVRRKIFNEKVFYIYKKKLYIQQSYLKEKVDFN